MNITNSKAIAVVILFVGSIIVGLLPKWFARQGRRQWPLLLSCLLCFGGGVLLATSLVHILPELREQFPKPLKEYSEIFFCVGFFILYVTDEIVHIFYGDTHDQPLFRPAVEHRHNNTYGATEREPLLTEPQAPYNPAFNRHNSEVPSQLCHVGHQEPCQNAPTTNLGLLVALSLHSLLEGLVVGLGDSSGKVLLLLGAIASHKLVVGFCLGTEVASNTSMTFYKHFLYILIFSVGSPIGIFCGMGVSDIPYNVTVVVIPILQGLAGGTLLYVTVSEILPRERARWHQQHNKKYAGILQFSSVVLGFIIMTGLSKYLDA